MAFESVRNLISGKPPVAPPLSNYKLPLTESEDAVSGAAYRLNRVGAGNFRLTLAQDTDKDAAAICLNDVDGAADDGSDAQVFARVAWITPGMVYKVPITDKDGTALTTLHTDVQIGATCNINDTGDGLDGETDTSSVDGPLSVIDIDEDEEVAWVVFNSCYLNTDRDLSA